VTGPAADFLTVLAAEGSPAEPSALELGTGTGRIALPLSARGVLVHGIDLPQAIVARLRAKPGAERVTVTASDFPTAAAGCSFRLVYLACNTIGNPASQDDQVECFGNAAAHLEPGGHFVIEVGLPDLRWLSRAGEISAWFLLRCLTLLARRSGRSPAAAARSVHLPWPGLSLLLLATVRGLGGGGWFAGQAGSRWPDGAERLHGRRAGPGDRRGKAADDPGDGP
jgi:SAM-dependent methyltransferase